MKTYPAVN